MWLPSSVRSNVPIAPPRKHPRPAATRFAQSRASSRRARRDRFHPPAGSRRASALATRRSRRSTRGARSDPPKSIRRRQWRRTLQINGKKARPDAYCRIAGPARSCDASAGADGPCRPVEALGDGGGGKGGCCLASLWKRRASSRSASRSHRSRATRSSGGVPSGRSRWSGGSSRSCLKCSSNGATERSEGAMLLPFTRSPQCPSRPGPRRSAWPLARSGIAIHDHRQLSAGQQPRPTPAPILDRLEPPPPPPQRPALICPADPPTRTHSGRLARMGSARASCRRPRASSARDRAGACSATQRAAHSPPERGSGSPPARAPSRNPAPATRDATTAGAAQGARGDGGDGSRKLGTPPRHFASPTVSSSASGCLRCRVCNGGCQCDGLHWVESRTRV